VKTLKLALLGATFLIGAAASANAADVYSRGGSLKDAGPAPYMPAISWTGFYVGAHLGSTLDDTFELSDGGLSVDFDVDENFLAGIHIGYNWQKASNLVFGIEASWSFLNGDADVEFDGVDLGTLDDNWLASIRGRLGFAAGSALIYGTGGVAFIDSDLFDDTQVGWVAGAGVEYKLRQNLSIGLEGLYYSFEDDIDIGGADVDLDRDLWTLQGRITWHMGGYGDALK
jgi:opacity protein-like surface antigen